MEIYICDKIRAEAEVEPETWPIDCAAVADTLLGAG